MSNWSIPLSDLSYGAEEEAAGLRVLKNRWLSSGPEVQTFEEEFAEFLGVKHAIAVANGTGALHLSYLALGLGPGDEIIQPAINFVAAANMTVAIGAIPVFVDITGLDEPTIDPEDIVRKVTSRTKAIVVMHYGGYLCRMDEIHELCRQYNLALIEDACHAVGARYTDPQGQPPSMAGSLSDIGCFSFFSNKNLATGEGGMVVTNRADLANLLRQLRSHGMTTLTWDRHQGHASSYDVTVHGYNYRLDDLHAALGRVQLQKLNHNNKQREQLVTAYHRNLSALPGWIIPFSNYSGHSSYHLMVVVAPDPEMRQQIMQEMKEASIQTSLHYPCIPDFKAFGSYEVTGLSFSRSFAQRVITLPLFPSMTMAQVDRVCSVIHRCISETGDLR